MGQGVTTVSKAAVYYFCLLVAVDYLGLCPKFWCNIAMNLPV